MADERELGVAIKASDQTQSVGAATERLKILNSQIRSLQQLLGASSAQQAAWGNATTATTRALQGELATLQATAEGLRAQIGAATGAAAAHGVLRRELDLTRSSFSRFTQDGAIAIKLFDEFARGQRGQIFSTLGAGVNRAGLGIGALLGPVAILGAGLGIEELAKHFGELALKTEGAAAAAGMSVSQYSLLQRTFQLVGGDANHITSIFGMMSEHIEQALVNPMSKARGAFDTLGISSAQLSAGLESPISIIDILRQRFQSMGASMERTELFRNLLGRGFASMVPILRLTDEEFANLEGAAQASGSVMGDEMANKMGQTAIKAHELGEAFSGLGMKIADVATGSGAFLQFLTNVVEGTTHALDTVVKFREELGKIRDQGGAKSGVSNEFDITDPLGSLMRRGFNLGVGLTSGTPPTPPITVPPIMGYGAAQPFAYTKGMSALTSPILDPEAMEKELTEKIRVIQQLGRVHDAEFGRQVASAGKNESLVNSIESRRVSSARSTAGQEIGVREQYAKRAEHFNDPELASKFRTGEDEARVQGIHLDTQRIQMQQRLAREAEAEKERQRRKDEHSMSEDHRNRVSQEKEVSDERMRPLTLQAASVEGRYGRDSSQYAAIKAQESAVTAQEVQVQMGIYDDWLSTLKAKYADDKDTFNQVQKEKTDLMRQEANRQAAEQAQALQAIGAQQKRQSEDLISDWANAFNQIGSQVESSIGQAVQAALVPMKPEYWWSTRSGPMGQPLMVPHRISPEAQIADQLGMSIAMDLGKALMGTITKSIAQSIFGPETKDMGVGLAKLLGIGQPGGLFGTGLGAVSGGATQAASTTTFASAVTMFQSAVLQFQADSVTSGAGGVGTAASSAGGIGSFLQGLPIIGGLFGGGGGSGIIADAAGLTLRSGGIIPSAAGGMTVPSAGGSKGVMSLLHPREMVLPEHLSTGLQNLIAGGGGTNLNLHFHGPADAPSIEAWFKNNLKKYLPGGVKSAFAYNSLTPRSI